MTRSNGWLQQLADRTELEAEALPGLPIVEIAGERRVLVERHGGVLEYTPERVLVRVSYGAVCITGCGLELTHMTHQQLIITGRVDSVCLHRRCRP